MSIELDSPFSFLKTCERLAFTASTSTALSNFTTKLLPPVKSIPYLNPFVAIDPIETATNTAEITYITFLFAIKSTQIFRNKFLVIGVQTDNDFPFSNLLNIITLDIKTEVKKVIIRPISNVTAKPWIGPVPKI